MESTPDSRILRGTQLLEQLWWSLAKRIIQKAGDLYKWDDEQWRTVTEVFLRPNDYKVIVYTEL
jgi:hypothetical protein